MKEINRIGKRHVVKMADMTTAERRIYLTTRIFKRNGILCHYSRNTINTKFTEMNSVEIKGLLGRALVEIFDNSPRLDRRIRTDAAIQYKKIHPAAVFTKPKIKFKQQSKKKK